MAFSLFNYIATDSKVIAPCKYKQGDILNLQYKNNTFDVSYSNGVLEHFSDEEIIETLKQQMNISKYVFFRIPSTYFNMNEKEGFHVKPEEVEIVTVSRETIPYSK